MYVHTLRIPEPWARVISPSIIQIGRRLYDYNRPFHDGEKSEICFQDATTAKSSLLEGDPLPMPTMFGRRPLQRSFVSSQNDRQNDRTTDHITPPVLAEYKYHTRHCREHVSD